MRNGCRVGGSAVGLAGSLSGSAGGLAGSLSGLSCGRAREPIAGVLAVSSTSWSTELKRADVGLVVSKSKRQSTATLAFRRSHNEGS